MAKLYYRSESHANTENKQYKAKVSNADKHQCEPINSQIFLIVFFNWFLIISNLFLLIASTYCFYYCVLIVSCVCCWMSLHLCFFAMCFWLQHVKFPMWDNRKWTELNHSNNNRRGKKYLSPKYCWSFVVGQMLFKFQIISTLPYWLRSVKLLFVVIGMTIIIYYEEPVCLNLKTLNMTVFLIKLGSWFFFTGHLCFHHFSPGNWYQKLYYRTKYMWFTAHITRDW